MSCPKTSTGVSSPTNWAWHRESVPAVVYCQLHLLVRNQNWAGESWAPEVQSPGVAGHSGWPAFYWIFCCLRHWQLRTCWVAGRLLVTGHTLLGSAGLEKARRTLTGTPRGCPRTNSAGSGTVDQDHWSLGSSGHVPAGAVLGFEQFGRTCCLSLE